MRDWVLLALIILLALFAVTRHDPDASNRIVIDEPDQLMHNAAGPNALLEVCENRALPGPQHTLNPHAPPGKRRQDVIKVCVEVLPDGRPPPRPPINIITIRKFVTIV